MRGVDAGIAIAVEGDGRVASAGQRRYLDIIVEDTGESVITASAMIDRIKKDAIALSPVKEASAAADQPPAPGSMGSLIARISASAGLLAVALASFHLRGEMGGGSEFLHLAVVCAREAVVAWAMTVSLFLLGLAIPRWIRPVSVVSGVVVALTLWAYLVYVSNRSAYPFIPAELLAVGHGAIFIGAALPGLVSWADLSVLAALLWGCSITVWRGARSPRPASFALSAIVGLALAGSVLLGRYNQPWLLDRATCFRQYGVYGLLLADVMVQVAGRSDGSGADLRFPSSARRLGDPLPWRPRRILLLQVESLDRTVLADPDIARQSMPFLSGVIADGRLGTLLVDARPLLAVHGVGGSADCEYATWFGCFPDPRFPWWREIDEHGGGVALSRLLAPQGVSAWSFHGNDGTFFARARNYTAIMGFAAHLDRSALGLRPRKWGSADGDFLRAVQARIAGLPSDGRWIAHAITFSGHAPFTWIDEYAIDAGLEGRRASFRRRYPPRVADYFATMAYLDQELAEFLPRVAGMVDLILLYGDHPSALTDEAYGDGSLTVAGRRVELTTLLRISREPLPMMPALASHVDLHATMADAFLPEGATIGTLGRSLLRENPGNGLPHGPYPELGAVRGDGLQVVVEPVAPGR
jgi:hypothetical protein